MLKIAKFHDSLWLHVAKSKGSLTRLKVSKPQYGPSPFSLCSLLLKDLSFSFYFLLAFYFKRFVFWSRIFVLFESYVRFHSFSYVRVTEWSPIGK